MSAVELHNIDDVVSAITGDISHGATSRRTWSVHGEPTAGKSAVLEAVHDYFRDEGTIRPVIVAAPTQAYDSAHAALIDLAEGLTLRTSLLEKVKDPEVSWSSKVQIIRRELGREGGVVLLLDEPRKWAPSESYFSSFVYDVYNLVFDGAGFVSVTAGPAPIHVQRTYDFHLDPASDPDIVLAGIDSTALTVARDFVAQRFGERLQQISPLQIRLLVAMAALDESLVSGVDASAAEHRAALVADLADLADQTAPDLRDLWLQLAAVREPFDEELLGLLGVRELVPRDAAIVSQCLLFPRHHGLVLHESLRSIRRQIEHDRTSVHARLASYYRHRFTDPKSDNNVRLRDSIEAFHHASSAGIADLEKFKPFFVDQLNILGYHLSYNEHDLARAADVFKLALDWDPTNPYAAHYRAYNLDRQADNPDAGVDPNEVEQLYRLAVGTNPLHPWFRARLITFLLAQARIDDAWTAWLDANEAFGPDADEKVYFGLHLHVARTLLYRGELRHTETLLRTLPPEVAGAPHFQAIRDRLWALREAQAHGSYVPAIYLKPGWYRHPNRLRSTGLKRWLAARVATVAEDVVELDVADITPGLSPDYGSVELQLETLRAWWKESADISSLAPGQFLEIGFYGIEGEQGEAVRLPRYRWEDLTLPDEDPDRYLRAGM
jgi:tetratricopeptide (TPR) repeat protein